MMKFFRKYTKHLLAVFMALLLVVWLAGDALTSMLGETRYTAKEVRGTAFGRDVRIMDMIPAYNHAKILDALFPPTPYSGSLWRMPWLNMAAEMVPQDNPQLIFMVASQIRREPLSNDEWYMLEEAAKKAGVHVPPEQVAKMRSNFSAESINALRNMERVSLDDIDRALQSFLRVQQLLGLAMDSLKVSEADVQDMIRQTAERVRIAAVVLNAKDFIDPNYQPTPEELQQHFEQYKDVASQPADSPRFGYQIPEAVQIEYIAVDAEALGKTQNVTDIDVHRYWTTHQREFIKPATQPASTAPATRPAAQPYETFSEARPAVLERMQKELGREQALRVARELIASLQRPWQSVTTTQPTDVKQAPESEKSPDVYSRLVDSLQQKYPGALKAERTQMLDRNQLQKLPQLGTASATAGPNNRISLAEAAALVPGLDSQRAPRTERLFRGLYETAAEPFVAADGNAYVIRTVAIRPKHAPESIDAVRPRLIEDVRRKKAFEAAEQQARQLADAARQTSLEQAFKNDAALVQKVTADALKTPPPVARKQLFGVMGVPQLYPDTIAGLGTDPELIDTIFGLVPGPATQPAAATQPVSVAVHPQRDQERVIVVEALEKLPITRSEYEQQRGSVVRAIRMQRQFELLSNWFNPQMIRDRIEWKPIYPEEQAAADGEAET